MNKKRKTTIVLFAISISLYGFLFAVVSNSLGNTDEYSTQLQLNHQYIYNITQFDSVLYWWDLDYNYKGDVISNPGGQIIVNFTGFYDKHPNDFSPFPDPSPYIDITFKEYQVGSLITNTTLLNITNAEAAVALAIGYRNFNSGFLVPNKDFNNLTQQAFAQNETGFWEVDINVRNYGNIYEIEFVKFDNSLNSTLKYDKATGLLFSMVLENLYGPDIKMFLLGYLTSTIPSFSIIIVAIITGMVAITLILSKKRMIKRI